MSARIDSYRDLVVWQQAMDLADAIYEATRNWPMEELYGLTSQVRRAASSVPANIAEGLVGKIAVRISRFYAAHKAR